MTTSSLGELLREFRRRAQLTREALAERAGVSVEAVRSLENGRRRHPRPTTLELLAAALAITPEELEQLRTTAARPPAGNRRLPAGPDDLIGRQSVLAELTAVLTESSQQAAAPPVVVAGMGGIGKTAVALRAAHLVADAFPDGTLFVNLRGHAGSAPTTAIEALVQLLQELGAAGDSIPGDVAVAAARFRSGLAGRRMLIVLDDAASAEQVEPLLPGAPGSAVLITSRSWLLGLAGARHLPLDLFDEAEAIDLLREVGVDQVDEDLALAGTVARLCGLLPLALRIAGGRLAGRPGQSLAELADGLADEQRKLELLTAEDTGVRAAIRLSVDALAAADRPLQRSAAAALPLISQIESDEFALRIAAAALNQPIGEAEAALEHLVDVSLLETPGPQRYRLHDLVRTFGREQVTRDGAESVRLRVLDQYVALLWRVSTADGHASVMTEGWRDPSWWTAAADLEFQQAVDLLDSERSGLVRTIRAAAAGTAAERRRVIRAAVGFDEFGLHRKRWSEWRDVNLVAVDVVDEHEDPLGAAMVTYDLGLALNELGDFTAGHAQLTRALGLVRRLGDRRFETQCLIQLSHALEQTGELEAAESLAREAQVLTVELADEQMESWCHLLLGMIAGRAGDLAMQDAEFDLAVRQLDRLPDVPPSHAAMRRLSIGESYLTARRYEQAEASLTASLKLFQVAERPNGVAEALDDLSAVLTETGRAAEALERQDEALRLAIDEELWDREASVRMRRGKTLVALGRPDEARTEWEKAAALYRSHLAPGTEEAERLLASLERRDGSHTVS
ncbi:transcriptional regulator, XRE family [Kribbella flavida DSM 17836]|uniref:Transcriptional regulator, XRE family n=1 Tax=Kribbella flavida (strain DSM 17836 / JCM 10339 / NBRC 14399) TaxID=479435 RepID=D2PN55_KRIFD|nr:XRE family transcriptional regulator [Kribbella flavida]ADB34539.1 transcriptional regulator, XRE family [Kribbella flavida DSM 17836]